MHLRILFAIALFAFAEPAQDLFAAAAQPSAPRLVGTVEGAPFAGAVFDDGTGTQTFYRLHEQLPDGSKLVRIWKDRVEVKRTDGALYEMYTTGDRSIASAAPATTPATPSFQQQPEAVRPPRVQRKFGRQRPDDD
jgi:hypothetical protein